MRTSNATLERESFLAGESLGSGRILYHGTSELFDKFEHTEDIGFHFGSKKAALDRMAKAGSRADVLIMEESPTPLERDCLRLLDRGVDDSSVETLYALLLRKLDSPRPNLLQVVQKMEAHEIAREIRVYCALPDSAQFAARVEKARAGQSYRVEVNGEAVFHSKSASEAIRLTRLLERELSRPIEVCLDIRNAIRLPDLGIWPAMEIAEAAGICGKMLETIRDGHTLAEKYRLTRAALAERGYDGIVYTNELEDPGSDSWIAFSADQIHLRRTRMITKEDFFRYLQKESEGPGGEGAGAGPGR